VNCSASSEAAFTGAVTHREGRFLGRFIPNFSQFITIAGEEQWQDTQIGDTFEGTAFDKPVHLTRRS